MIKVAKIAKNGKNSHSTRRKQPKNKKLATLIKKSQTYRFLPKVAKIATFAIKQPNEEGSQNSHTKKIKVAKSKSLL